MARAKHKHYEVIIAGVGYGVGQIAIKGHVIPLEPEEAERLEGLNAVVETDAELTEVREEAVPTESAQPMQSQEAHAEEVAGKPVQRKAAPKAKRASKAKAAQPPVPDGGDGENAGDAPSADAGAAAGQ